MSERQAVLRQLNETYRGVLKLMSDVRAFRAVDSLPSRGRLRRVKPSTRPLRRLVCHIRSEYEKYLDWLQEPDSRADIAETGHLPASRKQRDLEGLPGLAQWRLTMEADVWSAKRVRHHVVMVGAAMDALDRLDKVFDDLDERLSHRWRRSEISGGKDTVDDFAPSQLLEVVATLFAALAPVLADSKHSELSTGLKHSDRQSRKVQARWSGKRKLPTSGR
jgi:hypothetical protein